MDINAFCWLSGDTGPREAYQLHRWEENRFTIANVELSLPNRSELEPNFWTLGKFKSVFSQLTALWLNTHLDGLLQFGETGNNIFIIPILQMVELKPCKVYWLTPSCTACLNGSRTPAGLIPTPRLLTITLYLLLLTSNYFIALTSTKFYTHVKLHYKPLSWYWDKTIVVFFPPINLWQKFGFFCLYVNMHRVSENIQAMRNYFCPHFHVCNMN